MTDPRKTRTGFFRQHAMVVLAFVFGVGVGFFFRAKEPPRTVRGQLPDISARSDDLSSVHIEAKTPRKSVVDAASRAKLARKHLGEAVLDSEIPAIENLRSKAISTGVDEAMATSGRDYERLFAAYGFDEATTKRMLEHIRAIFRARAELQADATQLLHARRDYLSEMKSLLGDSIGEYERFERADSARRQVAQIESFALEQGLAVKDDEKLLIQSLIASHEAYTPKVGTEIGGVFHDWPKPMGAIEGLASTLVEKENLERRSNDVIAQARLQGLSPDSQKILSSYYANAIRNLDALIQQLNGTSPTPLQLRAAQERMRVEEAQQKGRLSPKTASK